MFKAKIYFISSFILCHKVRGDGKEEFEGIRDGATPDVLFYFYGIPARKTQKTKQRERHLFHPLITRLTGQTGLREVKLGNTHCSTTRSPQTVMCPGLRTGPPLLQSTECVRTLSDFLFSQRAPTCSVSPVSDPQGCRVGVDPIGDHAVVHRPARRNAVTGQQTHDAGVPVVELDHSDRRKGGT